ncbi:MAG: hypothetical protein AB9819_03455 [Methanomassiliicoccales archaeon]
MKKIFGALFSALLFMFLLSAMAVPAFAFTPTAEAPEWSVGDRWAFGADTDVGAEFDEILTNLTNMLEMTDEVDEVNEMSLSGGTEFWMLFEVTQVTDDEYVMEMDMATSVTMDATISITADLPVAGTYNYSDDPATALITVDADVGVDATMVVNVEVTYDKETMAVKSIAIDAKIRAAADFVANNLPQSDDDWMNSTETIWYEDYDVHAELEVNFDMALEFDPGMNLYDFPLAMNETWWSNFTVSFSGHLTGFLDIQGLPAEMEENIFSEDFVETTGISEFPIVFEEIGDMGALPFDNGEIEPFTTPEELELHMFCTDYFLMNDEFHGEIGVYEIRVGSIDSPVMFYYSDDIGFMASIAMDTEEMDLPDGIVTADMTTMAAVDPDVAEDNIAEIAERQGEVDEDGGMLGFFTDAPYLGIILVAVIVVVVVAAVFLIRKK